MTIVKKARSKDMSNPCSNPRECLDAIAVLKDQIRDKQRMMHDVERELIKQVIQDIERGRCDPRVLKLNYTMLGREY